MSSAVITYRRMYRISIDEAGNHDLRSSDDPNHQYLGLTGVMLRLEYEQGPFLQELNAIKMEIFGTTEIVLHRREIVDADPPFQTLRNAEVRQRFNELLLRLLAESTYRVFTVVIDKKEHGRKYQVWRFHPYHYCLTVVLERYVQWLDRTGQVGDVLVESRGKKENIQLEKAYRFIYDRGTNHVPVRIFKTCLTSRQLKIQPKTANLPALQLADLIVSPCCRDLICMNTKTPMTADFGRRVVEVLRKNKYLKNPYDGSIVGWGTKWLP